MTLSIDTAAVLGHLDQLAAATEWHGVGAALYPPVLGSPSADQTIGDVFALVRDLPRRYSGQLEIAVDAMLQAVVDVLHADGALPDGVEVTARPASSNNSWMAA